VLLELLMSGRYGHSRDELYFLVCGRRFAMGFVDQPPFTPAVAAAAHALFGNSLLALRFLSALAGGASVLVTALTARELGAGRVGQALAALCTATTGTFLAADHLLNTTAFDLLVWTVVVWIAVRILGGGSERLWLAAGAVAGVGLLNKHTVLFLLFGLLAGFLVADRRRLRSPWLWSGVAIALAIWSPNIVWQIRHDWPTIEMIRSLRDSNSSAGSRVGFVFGQLGQIGVLLAPVWIAGLVWLLRSARARPFRPLAWAYVALFVLFLVVGGKPYYMAGLYPLLFAAGAGVIERGDPRRWVPRPRTAAILALAGFVLALPIVLPVLPARTLADVPLQKINYDLAESIGWERITGQVRGVVHSLSPAERARAAILTANYGEAGALDLFGPRKALPPIVSGHNNYWLWGPPPADTTTVVAVGFDDRAYLERFFVSVTLVGRERNGLGVDNDEEGEGMWVCRGPRAAWAVLWPRLKDYA
jgi:4-amino-4-deoxy-L-arabinose transferase-like glycosyltransferase